MDISDAKPRVNGAMLAGLTGKKVLLVAQVSGLERRRERRRAIEFIDVLISNASLLLFSLTLLPHSLFPSLSTPLPIPPRSRRSSGTSPRSRPRTAPRCASR